jgi:hypothetical protein
MTWKVDKAALLCGVPRRQTTEWNINVEKVDNFFIGMPLG